VATTTLTRSSATSGRSSERLPRKKRRRRWLRWVVAVLILALVGTTVWLLGFSSVLATSRVEVSGADVLSSRQVRDAARVPLGLPLARQDLDAVANRVAMLAPVESVTVDRAWPDAVAISVTERTAVLGLRDPAGYTLVDRAGVAFQHVGRLPEGIVLVDANRTDTALLSQVALVANAFDTDLRSKVTAVRATSPIALTVVLKSGVTINWGAADQSALKAQIVAALLRRDPRHVDVSSPHNPAVR
jgi:cell division protein FtsQ